MIPLLTQVVYRPPMSRLVLAVLDERSITRLHRLRAPRPERSSWRAVRFAPSSRRHRLSHWKARRGGRR